MPLPTGQKKQKEVSQDTLPTGFFQYANVEIMRYVYITSNRIDKLHSCHDLFLNFLHFIRMSELFYNVSEWGPGAVKLQKVSW